MNSYLWAVTIVSTAWFLLLTKYWFRLLSWRRLDFLNWSDLNLFFDIVLVVDLVESLLAVIEMLQIFVSVGFLVLHGIFRPWHESRVACCSLCSCHLWLHFRQVA